METKIKWPCPAGPLLDQNYKKKICLNFQIKDFRYWGKYRNENSINSEQFCFTYSQYMKLDYIVHRHKEKYTFLDQLSLFLSNILHEIIRSN